MERSTKTFWRTCLAALALLAAPGLRAQAAPGATACGDTAEAADLATYASTDFGGDGKDAVQSRARLGLERVDSAEVAAVTDPAVCAAVRAVAEATLSGRVPYPYRLVLFRMGPYFGVAVRNNTPLPPGIVEGAREHLLILDGRTMTMLHDNIIY